MSRTKRKSYTGSKAIDKQCRGGGVCPACASAMKYKLLRTASDRT